MKRTESGCGEKVKLEEIATFIVLSKRSRHVNQLINSLQVECGLFRPYLIWTSSFAVFNLRIFYFLSFSLFSYYCPHSSYSYSPYSCTPSSFFHLSAYIPSVHQSYNDSCIKILDYNLNNHLHFVAFVHHGPLSGRHIGAAHG